MKWRFVFLGTVAAAVAIFLWGTISHLVLPWHHWTMTEFVDSRSVAETIQANTTANGIFFGKEGTFAVVSLRPDLADKTLSLGGNLAKQFVNNLIVAFLLALALLGVKCPTVLSRAGFIAMLGFAAGVAIHIPHWNWYGFSAAYTIINTIDLTVGWFLGGLVLAVLARKMLPTN